MTDITELAQREKFEAWLEGAEDLPWGYLKIRRTYDGFYSEHTYTSLWGAWKAASAELVEALDKAQTINAAAETLVRCKGRYHSEQNYRALAALFGVTAPDLPPLDGEQVGEVVEVGGALLVEWRRCLEEGAKLYTTPQAPVMPFGLHPDTQNLVTDFCTALAEKLYKAQLKYGYDADWKHDGWPSQCQAHFHQHIAKGDPRDVAAYCAFMWYHGWRTEVERREQVVPDEVEHVAAVLELIGGFEAADIDSDTVDLRFEIDDVDTDSDVSITEYAARAAAIIRMLAGNSPVIPDGWTGNDKANAALMMLDRIETVDPVDDDRIDGIKRIVHELAAAPQEVKGE